MNAHFKLIFWLSLFFVAPTLAQDFSDRSNVNIINATNLNVEISLNYVETGGQTRGGSVKLVPGKDMGLFSVAAESIDLAVKDLASESGVRSVRKKAKLAGELQTECYVVFLALTEKKVKGKIEKVPSLKLRKVKVATEAQGASLSVVSVCQKPRIFKFGKRQVRLEPWKSWLLDDWKGEEVTVFFEGEIMSKIPARDEPLTMLAIISEDADQKPRLSNFVYAIRR